MSASPSSSGFALGSSCRSAALDEERRSQESRLGSLLPKSSATGISPARSGSTSHAEGRTVLWKSGPTARLTPASLRLNATSPRTAVSAVALAKGTKRSRAAAPARPRPQRTSAVDRARERLQPSRSLTSRFPEAATGPKQAKPHWFARGVTQVSSGAQMRTKLQRSNNDLDRRPTTSQRYPALAAKLGTQF